MALCLQNSLLQEKCGMSKTMQMPTDPAFSGKQWWHHFNIRSQGLFPALPGEQIQCFIKSPFIILLTDACFLLGLDLLRSGFASLIALLALGFS